MEFECPNEAEAWVTGIGTFAGSKLVIPSEYNGRIVVCINPSAFENCTQLVEVVIPDTIDMIEPYVFRNCSNLEKITLPKYLDYIDKGVFEGCSKLVSVTLPDDVWWIDEDAFKNCTSLREINTPESLEDIGDYAFSGCSSLKSFSLPSEMYSLSKGVFKNCSSLESIVIPDDVVQIEEEAFYGCTSLKSVNIPVGINSIKNSAFAGCKALESVVFDSQKTISFGNRIFEDCSNLKHVKLSENIKTIPDYAFKDCVSLSEIVFPDAVRIIGVGAFYGCSGLKNVTFPAELREIRDSAFENCDIRGEITFPGHLGRVESSAFKNNKGITALHIPELYLMVTGAPFEGCTGLKKSYCYPQNTEDLRDLFEGLDVEMYVYGAIDRTYDDVDYDFSMLWGYGYCKYYDETLGTGNDYRTLYKRIYTAYLNYNNVVVTADLKTEEFESEINSFVVGDHPELLYAKRYSADLSGRLSLGFNKVDQCKELYPQCEASLNEIKRRIINKYGSIANATKIQRVKIIHDYLVLKKEYGSSEWDQTMAGVLADDYTPVCMSYSLAFKWCCNQLGIQCEVVLGQEAQGLHAWNLINYSDTVAYCGPNTVINADDWYEIDVTWDDPLGCGESFIWYRYFNLDSATMYRLSPREWEDRYYPTYPITDCRGTRYSYDNCVNAGLFN